MSEKVELVAEFKNNLSGPMKTAGGDVKQFGKMAAGAGALVVGLGVAVLALAKKMGDLAADVRDVAFDLGVTTDTVQGINYAFEQTGGGADTFGKAMKGVTAFLRSASRGGAEQIAVLDGLGISYEHLTSLSPDEQFYLLTDAIGAMEDPTKRATDAAVLFGGASQQIIGTLEQAEGSIRSMSEAFQESDMMIPEEDIMRLGQFADKWTDLEKKMESLMAEAIMPMLPIIEEMADEFIDVASDAIPQIISAIEDALPILMTLIDTISLAADGWNKLTGGDVDDAIDETTERLTELGDSLQGMVNEGLMTAAEAMEQYKIESELVITSMTDNGIQQSILRDQTYELAGSFDFAKGAAWEFRRVLSGFGELDTVGILTDVGVSLASAGENMLGILGVDIDEFKAKIEELSTTPVGVVTDNDVEETLEKLNTLKDRQIAILAEIAAEEKAAADDRLSQEEASNAAQRAARLRVKEERLQTEIDLATEREKLNQGINRVLEQGATNVAGILISGGENWEEQMLKAIAKMAIQMAAMAIGGPLGWGLSFFGGLFQKGGRVQHAQGGATVVGNGTGLFGDLHPFLLERDEVVIPREQVLMGNTYNNTPTSISVVVPYQPTFSSASPGEMVIFSNAIIKALEQAGVDL